MQPNNIPVILDAIILFILIVFTSCGNFNFMNGENPRKKSFKYYDSNFKFDSLSNLKINRKYLLTYTSSVDILVFFNDGFLNNYATDSVNSISGTRSEGGSTMGYYKLKKDSIFFTTKSYYQHRATYYRGLIKNDTLDLEIKYPAKKKFIKEKYVLY